MFRIFFFFFKNEISTKEEQYLISRCFSKVHLKKKKYIICTIFHENDRKSFPDQGHRLGIRKFSHEIFPFPWSTISHKYFRLAVITGGDRSDVTTFSLTPRGCLKDRKREVRVVRLTTNLLRKIEEGESKFGTPTLCCWGSILGYTCTRRGDPTGRKHRTPRILKSSFPLVKIFVVVVSRGTRLIDFLSRLDCHTGCLQINLVSHD